ncbi:hypothetical protein ES705_29597 [subsurface metagenome]
MSIGNQQITLLYHSSMNRPRNQEIFIKKCTMSFLKVAIRQIHSNESATWIGIFSTSNKRAPCLQAQC